MSTVVRKRKIVESDDSSASNNPSSKDTSTESNDFEDDEESIGITQDNTDIDREGALILVVGDLHFAVRSRFLLDELEQKILTTIAKYKPDIVVWLGDTLDRFGTVSTVYSEQAIEFLKRSTELSRSVLLIGNHDIPNKTYFMSSKHPFTAVKYWENMKVVDTECYEFEIKGHVFQAVPYCPNGRFREGLNTLKDRNQNPTAIFCHQEMKGCNKDGKGMISTDGDAWELSDPLCICGHIHKDHTPQSNIEYVGSPYQDNFGEDTDKSISLYSFGKDSYTRKRIYLNLPTKQKLFMTVKEYNAFKLKRKIIYWITVTGSTIKNANAKELNKTKLIKSNGGSVIFINTNKYENENVKVEVRPLRNVVAESISKSKNKKKLQSVYDKVFV